MRKYIRTDTRKASEEDIQIINAIIEEHKLPPKQGKSAAYGIGLQTWKDLRHIPNSVADLKDILNQVLEEQKQSYFVIQALVAQVGELRQVIQEQEKEQS